MKRPTPLSDLMASVFRGKPAEKRLEEGRIWLVWDATVGPQIAGKARPIAFRDGVLTVAVANSPWMQQLTFLKQGMIEKLNQRLGGELVRDIYLKAGRPEVPLPPHKEGGRRERPLDATERVHIAEQTAAITDPELRAALARLLERHTTSAKSPR